MSRKLPAPGVGSSCGLAAQTTTPNALPRQMLSLLSEGGIASTADLSRRLGVSEPMVAMMAEELARRGYLAPMGGCRGGCGGCHIASACDATGEGQVTMLVLTPKGRQASI